MHIEERLRGELAELESRAQLRHLETPRGIDFSSNDYLGLATDARMKRPALAALEAAPRVASTGSRLLAGQDDAWTALEKNFACWIGSEAALFFNSGYTANIGLLSAVLRAEDVVFSDAANHASLIDGLRLARARRVIFPHLDLPGLEDALSTHRHGPGMRFIVTESIFSMDGTRAPLADLANLAARFNAELIVDEAHSTGVCGPAGRGSVAEAGLAGRVFATVHTCGKALASAGAFVCGSESLRRLLINRARTFIFTTALPPYFAAQVAAGMQLAAAADSERGRLLQFGAVFRDALQHQGFHIAGSSSHIVPIILGPNDLALETASRLQRRGYSVRAIRPPTVAPDTARLRLSLTACLSQPVLADFISALVETRNELTPASAARQSR